MIGEVVRFVGGGERFVGFSSAAEHKLFGTKEEANAYAKRKLGGDITWLSYWLIEEVKVGYWPHATALTPRCAMVEILEEK